MNSKLSQCMASFAKRPFAVVEAVLAYLGKTWVSFQSRHIGRLVVQGGPVHYMLRYGKIPLKKLYRFHTVISIIDHCWSQRAEAFKQKRLSYRIQRPYSASNLTVYCRLANIVKAFILLAMKMALLLWTNLTITIFKYRVQWPLHRPIFVTL